MKIPFKGLVRNTPAGLAQDGELEDVCNVRYKDGAWRTIPERVAIFDGETLPYTNIFIHSNAGYKHYLGLKADGTFEYFAKDSDENVPELLPTIDVKILTTLTAGATFTQIGNVININNNGLKYLIWYDNAYVLIDSNFDGAQDSTELLGKIDLKVDLDEYVYPAGGAVANIRRSYFADAYIPYGSDASAYTTEADVKVRGEMAVSLLKKGISLYEKDGFITDKFHLACTAIELYDGSYISHSQPTLLAPANDKYCRYDAVSIGGTLANYITNRAVYLGTGGTIDTNNISPDNYKRYITNTIESAQAGLGGTDEIDCDSIGGFVGWSQLLNIGSGGSNNYVANVGAYVFGSSLKYKTVSNIPQELKPLIKSISIFITPGVSLYNEGLDISKMHQFPSTFLYNHYPKPKTNAEIITELAALKNFFKVHEIPFDNITAGDWTTIDLKDKLGDSLLTLQPLPIDNFSHHTTLPEVQFVYNSKLHIANYKTLLSRGWPVSYFHAIQGIGQFPALHGNLMYGNDCWAEAHIKTEIGTSKVVRYKLDPTYTQFELPKFGMLSYPDSRAFKLVIYVRVGTSEYPSYYKQEFPLKESLAANFAYYINPDLKPFTLSYTEGAFINYPDEVQRILTYQNTLKVSEVNNPFMFPAINTYQIGNGDIIGLATNTVALSTGQFGQFPVYVFCTDGIYGLYVGGAEINYSSSRPVSREVCNNAHSIKAIDTGVIFTTDKGVMVLVGSEVKELSEPLRGGIFDINKLPLFKQALNHVKLTSLLPEITTEKIHDYIQSAIVGYNYTEREIWFTNPARSYSYIFSQGAWYKVKQTGSKYIDDYPKQYILEDGKLIDISSEEGTYQQCYLLTRPIKMGDVEFKQMLTAVIRGRMLVENVQGTPVQKKWAGIHVYGSYDGERWVFLGGNEKNGELNDFGTRVERTDCKYFRVAFYGNINNESYINYLELEGKQSILSTKLR